MEYIGNRISILENGNSLSIVVFSYRHRLKNILIFAWVIAFTTCGLLAISEFRISQEHDRKIFWLVFISFWVYFELTVLKSFLWRLRGKETIRLTKDIVKIKRDFTGFERFTEYRVEQISNWKRLINEGNSLINSYENAYWFVGGERITFDYYGRGIRLGLQLTDAETIKLLGKIKQYYSIK